MAATQPPFDFAQGPEFRIVYVVCPSAPLRARTLPSLSGAEGTLLVIENIRSLSGVEGTILHDRYDSVPKRSRRAINEIHTIFVYHFLPN